MASRDIKDLIRKGIVRLPKKGGRVYELCTPQTKAAQEKPAEYLALEPLLRSQGYVTNKDMRTMLGISRRQATRVAEQLCNLGLLKPEGERRWRRYSPIE